MFWDQQDLFPAEWRNLERGVGVEGCRGVTPNRFGPGRGLFAQLQWIANSLTAARSADDSMGTPLRVQLLRQRSQAV